MNKAHKCVCHCRKSFFSKTKKKTRRCRIVNVAYCQRLSRISIFFRNVKNPHYTENMFCCGLNVLLDCSGHSTVVIVFAFIVSGLKYHSL
jgi:hypothetical protein